MGLCRSVLHPTYNANLSLSATFDAHKAGSVALVGVLFWIPATTKLLHALANLIIISY